MEILRAPAPQRLSALEILFRSPWAGRAETHARAHELLEAHRRGKIDLSGLFVVRDGEQIVNACLVLVSPGRTGVLWPSPLPVAEPQTAQLLAACHGWARGRGVVFMQASLDPSQERTAALLVANGYRPIARLRYMERPVGRSGPSDEADPWRWASYDEENAETFAEVIQETYQGSQDCPQWHDSRSVGDIIAGHKAEGVFDPDTWLLALADGKPVGCVLLNRVPELESLDIVYMGVVPRARKRGVGRAVVSRALRVAADLELGRVTLAVDEQNAAALGLYRSMGFRDRMRRAVFGMSV